MWKPYENHMKHMKTIWKPNENHMKTFENHVKSLRKPCKKFSNETWCRHLAVQMDFWKHRFFVMFLVFFHTKWCAKKNKIQLFFASHSVWKNTRKNMKNQFFTKSIWTARCLTFLHRSCLSFLLFILVYEYKCIYVYLNIYLCVCLSVLAHPLPILAHLAPSLLIHSPPSCISIPSWLIHYPTWLMKQIQA